MKKAENIIQTIEKNNGVTFDSQFNLVTKKTGYFVSFAGCELVTNSLTNFALLNYVFEYKLTEGQYFGVWQNNGLFYFDVSMHFESFEGAVKFGMKQGQKAIFDCANNTEIFLRSAQTAGTDTQKNSYINLEVQRLKQLYKIQDNEPKRTIYVY